jgi:hypothetical protein
MFLYRVDLFDVLVLLRGSDLQTTSAGLGGGKNSPPWIVGGMIAASFLPDTRPATNDAREAAAAAKPKEQSATLKKQSSYGETLRLLLIPAVVMVVLVTVMRQTGSGVQSSFYVIWLREQLGLDLEIIHVRPVQQEVLSSLIGLNRLPGLAAPIEQRILHCGQAGWRIARPAPD